MRQLQSDNIDLVVAALIKAQAEIDHAVKDATNPHFKSRYATLESVIDATRIPFAKCDLVIAQLPTLDGDKWMLVTQLSHKSGQWIRSYTEILNTKGDAQGMGSAISYARRYALLAIANIGDEDDDANKAVAPKPNPIQVVKQAATKAVDDPGAYVCTFGKFKGQKLGDVDMYELDNYVQYIESQLKQKGEPPKPSTAEFLKAAVAFLETRGPANFKTGEF